MILAVQRRTHSARILTGVHRRCEVDADTFGVAVLILGQFLSGGPPPSPLAEAPTFERFVLDGPVALMLVLFLGALIALFAGRSAGKLKHGGLAALVFVVVAVGAWVASTLVETDREQIKRRSSELIGAVATVDERTLDRVMADNVVMRYVNSPSGIGKDEIISHVELHLGGLYALKSHAVLQSQATLESENVGISQIQVQAVAESGMSLTSWWRLDWVKDSGGQWRVTRINPLHDLIRARR